MDTKSFYTSKQVFSLISKFLAVGGQEELQTRFTKALKDLNENQCRIPVLGLQGSGKSSFLNAVLFGDILLPVDAQETTCIPTEIRYGETAAPKAEVVFLDGIRKEVPCTEEGLAQYVHQEHNRENRLNVSHIEICVKNELLRNGLVLVDLPGVGSITIANQKTTLDYLKKSSAAIYLLRTVPPITRSEAVYIQGALPLLNKIFWVQNQWLDESNEEINEGCDFNEEKLKLIAKKVHKPQEYISRPTVVCVKHALDGKIDDDPKMVAKSNIAPFMKNILQFAENWHKAVQNQLRNDAHELVINALGVAAEKKKQYEQIMSGKENEAKEELEAQLLTANQIKDENRALTRKVNEYVREQKQKLQKNISDLCRTGAENLRNQVRDLIDKGVTGGARLEEAYNDCAKEVLEEVFQALQQPFLTLIQGSQQIIQDLKPISLSKADFHVHGIFSQKSKAHAHYGKIGGGVGIVAGTAAGAVATGATAGIAGMKVGATIGTLVPIPAIGTAIGAVLGGLIGSLIGIWGGKKTAKIQLDRQREIAREELFKQIDIFKKELENNYRTVLDNYVESIEGALRDWNKEQNSRLEHEYEVRKKDFSASKTEIQNNLKNIESDIVALNKLEKEIM